jgi:hypothetical protein
MKHTLHGFGEILSQALGILLFKDFLHIRYLFIVIRKERNLLSRQPNESENSFHLFYKLRLSQDSQQCER